MIRIFEWSDAFRDPGGGIKRINIVDDRNVYVGYVLAPEDVIHYVFLRNSPCEAIDYTCLPRLPPPDLSAYIFDARYHRRYNSPAGVGYCEVFRLLTPAGGVRYLLMTGATHHVDTYGFQPWLAMTSDDEG